MPATTGGGAAMTDVTIDDAAFDDLFTRVITPALAPHEAERQRLVKRFWNAVKAGAAVAACIVLPLMIFKHDGDIVYFALMIVLVFAGIAYIPVGKFEKRCKTEALTALAGALGMTYACEDFDPPNLEKLREFSLVEGWDDESHEDLFAGTRAGSAFQLYEAHLTTGTGKERETVFRGQVITVAFPKTFLGITVVNREGVHRWTWTLGKPKPKLQKVGLESSQFERIFEVQGTDQVEARYLVHPVFMEKLMAVEAANAGKNIRCVFDEGDLIIVIEGSDLFEVVEVFKPLPDRAKTENGVKQIGQVLGLIDAVMAPPAKVYG
jgi:hypothetical protein